MNKNHKTTYKGQSLVEFALLLPVFLLIMLFVVDFGRATYYFSVIHNAAREGTRYGIVSPDDTTGIIARVKSFAIGLDPTILAVTPSQPDDFSIRVQVSYNFIPVTPLVKSFLPGGQINIHSQSTMRIER